ncbi:MAG: hypothetical protein V9E98_14005 [Candidatus Nanopelagicales bacterium]
MAINPRTLATTARGAIIIGSGLALGLYSTHLLQEARATAEQQTSSEAARAVKPRVVTIVRTKHVPSKPIIVYRKVPVYTDAPSTASSSGGASSWSGSGSSGWSGGGGSSGGSGSSTGSAPAPQPAPAQAPPAASSGSS